MQRILLLDALLCYITTVSIINKSAECGKNNDRVHTQYIAAVNCYYIFVYLHLDYILVERELPII
jgi:hypothetical protein